MIGINPREIGLDLGLNRGAGERRCGPLREHRACRGEGQSGGDGRFEIMYHGQYPRDQAMVASVSPIGTVLVQTIIHGFGAGIGGVSILWERAIHWAGSKDNE